MKPIKFNTEMVKAILDNRKTQTRRLVKINSGYFTGVIKNTLGYPASKNKTWFEFKNSEDCQPFYLTPKYQVGDILYVQETWQNVFETEYDKDAEGYCVNIRTQIKNFDSIPKTCLGISTEDSCKMMVPRNKYCVYLASDIEYTSESYKLRWRSSTSMPKEAARIFLKVTAVRVERLQEITEEDAKAEGVINNDAVKVSSYIWWFVRIWDSIYGNWNDNPWVWVYTFERCEREVAK